MHFFKSYIAAMDAMIERKRAIPNPLTNPVWLDSAHERVMDHVNEMITSGRTKNFPVMGFKSRKDLTVEEQDKLDDMENGVYG